MKIFIFDNYIPEIMITKIQINEFYSQSHMALIGVSRNKKKFGFMVFNELKNKGYTVYPVNRNADTIEEVVCYRTIDTLPAQITAAVVMTPKKSTLEAVQQLILKGIKQIWIQQSSDTPEAIELAGKNGVNLIYGKCIFMFSEPVTGMHKFHKSILRFFNRLPN